MSEVRIVGATVPGEGLARARIVFDEQRIISCALTNDEPGVNDVDGRGAVVMPGLVDIHIHGAGGVDASEPEHLTRMAAVLAHHGVTSFLPTLPAMSMVELLDLLPRIARAIRLLPAGVARVPGIHLEGPFLNPRAAGAMVAELFQPARLETLDRILEAGEGFVRVLTLAPELEGACAFIRHAVKRDVVVSMGHSQASGAVVEEAVAAGATRVTHLLNAMAPLHQRNPGLVGMAMLPGGPGPEMIADCRHLSPLVMELVLRLRGGVGEGLCLVSDALAPAGSDVVETTFCGRSLKVNDGALYAEDGQLCGSAMLLSQGVERMVEIGLLDLSTAARLAAFHPAQVAGLTNYGAVRPGWQPDLALWRNGALVKCWIKGREVDLGH